MEMMSTPVAVTDLFSSSMHVNAYILSLTNSVINDSVINVLL
jgi:hypothetical protein